MNSNANTDDATEVILRFRAGDESARAQLIQIVQERFRVAASSLMGRNPKVRRWESTDDVMQDALFRLSRALDEIKPDSVAALISLMRLQFVRQLTDLAKKHYGPLGIGKNQRTDANPNERSERRDVKDDKDTYNPSHLNAWTEFQNAIGQLEPQLREVFEMAWYEMLTHEEMAVALNCSTKTIQRRFRDACMQLQRLCEMPSKSK